MTRVFAGSLFLLVACKREEPVRPAVAVENLAVVDVDAGPVVVAAAGDISDRELTGQVATAALIADAGYAAVLLLGDDQYPAGALEDYQKYFEPTWGRFKPLIHPVPGNHEYKTPGAAGYFGYFGAQAGEPGKGWYSFELGAWHLVALNTSDACRTVKCDETSEQVKWLREDLIAHRNRCTLAYWHHPRYSSGEHHGDFAGAEAIWQTLQRYGADLVLNGHEHLYERMKPIAGLRELVVGTGGISHYPARSKHSAYSEVLDETAYGILELTLKAGAYDWRFVPVPGATFTDSGSDTCH